MATSLTVQNNITLSGSQTLSFGFLGHTYLLCANTSRSMVIWIKQLPCREEDAKDGMVYILCTDHQGNLLLGIVNWSGVACNVVQGHRVTASNDDFAFSHKVNGQTRLWRFITLHEFHFGSLKTIHISL
jgi:hypothetical protein